MYMASKHKPSLLEMQQTPPPPPPSSPGGSSAATSFPILAISLIGILTTAILLVSYYIFVIKCCVNWRGSDVLSRLISINSRRRRHEAADRPLTAYSTSPEGHGLEESAIQAIPTFRFRQSSVSGQPFHECAVCLNEFQQDEKLRLLPNCLHSFHIDCIDIWLQTHANCPLCRSEITAAMPVLVAELIARSNSIHHPLPTHGSGSIVIDIRDEEGRARNRQTPASSSHRNPSPRKKAKNLQMVSSMGDECIDARGKDEQFSIQPIRRSISMDSSRDRQMYLGVQEILRQNQRLQDGNNGEGSSGITCGGSASARFKRSFFSFSHGRSSRSAVLPVQIDL